MSIFTQITLLLYGIFTAYFIILSIGIYSVINKEDNEEADTKLSISIGLLASIILTIKDLLLVLT